MKDISGLKIQRFNVFFMNRRMKDAKKRDVCHSKVEIRVFQFVLEL